jgi:NADPH-dependent 2,4-dienoyl-CoA reductase/sulfur reductase-like enzyme
MRGRPQEAELPKSPREAALEKDAAERANTALDRRSFLATGAAVGAVAAMPVQPAQAADAIGWDREVDVVVIGAGAGGLVAAIAAREKGASVLVVEKNFDIGGRRRDEFWRPLYRRRQPAPKGERGERHARSRIRGLVASGEADGPVQRPRTGAHLGR